MKSVTLNLPDALYERAKEIAEQKQSSLEAEILETLEKSLPNEDALEPDLADALESLDFLDDKALWKAAQGRLPQKLATKIAQLHRKRSLKGLETAENRLLKNLLHQADRVMLIRAKSAVLLKERGYDISTLAKPK
jgi:predicted transcriptional regulator